MEVNNQSSEALEVDNSRADDEEIDDEETEEEIFDDEGPDSDTTPPVIRKHSATSQAETLAVPSCYLHSEVPGEYTTLRRPRPAKLKKKVQGSSNQEALASVIAQGAQSHSHDQLQLFGCSPSSMESSPICTVQPISSFRSPILQEERLAPVANNNSICTTVQDKKNASDSKSVSTFPIVGKLRTDGYNWRKYGQKQVKSPQGSRSYYKCTCTQCYAKKIECSDHSNCVTDIIYKGQHNHELPKKVNRSRETKLTIPVLPVDDNKYTSEPIQELMDTGPSTCTKEVIPETHTVPEMKQNDSVNSNGDAKFKVKEVHADEPEPEPEPEPKQRLKKNGSSYSGALLKPGKKPKLVVHAAGDVGISGDGYRWRKYGQKMVKGNPHPRNYYRCTSAGCPVRKHIERAVNSSTGVIISYKGVHDHDMPVPKKRHCAPSGLLVASPLAMNNLLYTRTEALSDQVSATQQSVNAEGLSKREETLDVEEEKAVDSTRTLLSIDFEIKPSLKLYPPDHERKVSLDKTGV